MKKYIYTLKNRCKVAPTDMARELTANNILRFKRRILPVSRYDYLNFPVVLRFKSSSPPAHTHSSAVIGHKHSNLSTVVRTAGNSI